MTVRGLARWRAAPGSRPPLQVDLWTERPPSAGARERLWAAMPELRTSWYSNDLTVISTPGHSPAPEIDGLLTVARDHGTRHRQTFDLLWFNSHGLYLGLLDARAPNDHDPVWQIHIQRLAARREQPILDASEPLPERRLVRLLDALAARLDPPGDTIAPRPAWARAPERLDVARGIERLGRVWNRQIAEQIAPACARFGSQMSWWWLAEPCGDRLWSALVGLGHDQLLALASIE